MKTAMEKKTGLMRLIGYLSFVVVLLYGAGYYKMILRVRLIGAGLPSCGQIPVTK